MKLINSQLKIGLSEPFRVVHISDTHLTYADMRDGERKVELAARRSPHFQHAEATLALAIEESKKHSAPILHTGDLIDFVSMANLERAKQLVEETDLFIAAGNHEFSQYVGEAVENAAYRNQSLAKVQAAFKNDIRMSSRVFGGVNFIALDNGYYQFEAEQLDFLKKEVEKRLPIVLMFHTPLFEREFYERCMNAEKRLASYLAGVPRELMAEYSIKKFDDQVPDENTLAFIEYINSQPLVVGILTGHLHRNDESVIGGRIPQFTTNCHYVRIIEIF